MSSAKVRLRELTGESNRSRHNLIFAHSKVAKELRTSLPKVFQSV